jgi:hypothetical protein
MLYLKRTLIVNIAMLLHGMSLQTLPYLRELRRGQLKSQGKGEGLLNYISERIPMEWGRWVYCYYWWCVNIIVPGKHVFVKKNVMCL